MSPKAKRKNAKRPDADWFDRALMEDLLVQKRRYEEYFAEKPSGDWKVKIDNQSQSAYMSIIKALHEMHRKLCEAEGPREEDLKALAEEILREDYGTSRG